MNEHRHHNKKKTLKSPTFCCDYSFVVYPGFDKSDNTILNTKKVLCLLLVLLLYYYITKMSDPY